MPGCENQVVSKGLCDKHRIRLRKYGDPNFTKRPKGWGKKEAHPLYQVWIWKRRSVAVNLSKEWEKDFWQFVRDVGEKPGDNFVLMAANEDVPLGVNNFEWIERYKARDRQEAKCNNRMREAEWRKNFPQAAKNHELKKNHGITVEDYNRMKKAQDGKCAICGQVETMINSASKKTLELAVDHCHVTGTIRELLCSQCNNGLGRFKDSPELLEKAAEYIRKHTQ